MAVGFIGGGNQSTQRNLPIRGISKGFELTTLVVIGTDCTDSCKSNYHTITTTTALGILMLFCYLTFKLYTNYCHTAIENLSDPIDYLLDFTNPYYTALAGNMKARAKKDNSF